MTSAFSDFGWAICVNCRNTIAKNERGAIKISKKNFIKAVVSFGKQTVKRIDNEKWRNKIIKKSGNEEEAIMTVYFTNNQYLKTAEEDFEAAELLYGHKYYDQIGTLCSVAMTKYLKAVLEAIYPA